jgi:hypothetical protein
MDMLWDMLLVSFLLLGLFSAVLYFFAIFCEIVCGIPLGILRPDNNVNGWSNLDGNVDVEQCLPGLFRNALRVDLSTAIRSANVKEQNFSVFPRHWFIDAWFRCESCNEEFCWTAEEQRYWFDELKFNVASAPRHCKKCRQSIRLRKRYNAGIMAALKKSASVDVKKEMLDIIDRMSKTPKEQTYGSIPRNRQTLENQLQKG